MSGSGALRILRYRRQPGRLPVYPEESGERNTACRAFGFSQTSPPAFPKPAGSEMKQLSLFDYSTPAEQWEEESARRALDELFSHARMYRSGEAYGNLLKFIARFRSYSPYNAMLLHIQMPEAVHVAPAHRWIREYGRTVKANARPLVILQPMGPVMFVFDLSETEQGTADARPLPREKETAPDARKTGGRFQQTMENAIRDGIRIRMKRDLPQAAGPLQEAQGRDISPLPFPIGRKKQEGLQYMAVPVGFEISLKEGLDAETLYPALVHELARLYCGHLGSPNRKWWPNRTGLSREVREFEAESVARLVCARLGVRPPGELIGSFLEGIGDIPPISLECIMKSAGLIEQMGNERLKPRET